MSKLLHDELHKLCDTLIDIKTVIRISDEHLHSLHKRHIALIVNSEDRIKKIEEQIDKMMSRTNNDMMEHGHENIS